MQYAISTVGVTQNSATVTGANTKFLSNVTSGYAFKVSGDSVVYTIGAVVSDTELTLSYPYLGATNATAQYQIVTDYTVNYGLAEVNMGDQDWPIHLTQGTIRRIDKILADFSNSIVSGVVFKGAWNAATNTPTIPAAAEGNNGWMYKVTVAGTTNVSGNATWEVDDTLISNGSTWVKIPGNMATILAMVDSRLAALDSSVDSAALSAQTASTAAAEVSTALTNLIAFNAPDTGTLITTDVRCTQIDNIGQTAATVLTLPTCSTGLNFIAIIGQGSSYEWGFKAATGDRFYVNGVAYNNGGTLKILTPTVGAYISVTAIKTGASSVDWLAVIGSGNWAVS